MSQYPEEVAITPERRASPLMLFFTIIGGCAVLLVLIVVAGTALMLPYFEGSKLAARRSICVSNAKQLSSAFLMYSQDWDDRLPLANSWYDGAMPYVKNTQIFVCPARPGVPNGYAFNSVLDGARTDWVTNPAAQPLAFESLLGARNGSDLLQSFFTPHDGMGTMAYVDGHVQAVAAAPPAGKRPTPPPGTRAKKGARP